MDSINFKGYKEVCWDFVMKWCVMWGLLNGLMFLF